MERTRWGRVLVPFDSLSGGSLAQYLTGNYAGLYANAAFGCQVSDLRPLAGTLPSQYLYFVQRQPIRGFEYMDLSNLRSLVCEDVRDLDLTWSPKLEVLGLSWSNSVKGLDSTLDLKLLSISKFVDQNLRSLESLRNLEEFACFDSSVLSLAGLGNFFKLWALDISGCPNLTHIDGLSDCRHHLTHVTLDRCRTVSSYEPIRDLELLESLTLTGVHSVKSIRFLKNAMKLRRLCVPVEILDGDVAFLGDLPKLESLILPPKRHHNTDVRAFPSYGKPWHRRPTVAHVFSDSLLAAAGLR